MDKDRNANLKEYLTRMTISTGETSKSELVNYVKGNFIVDFGCGSGVLTKMLAEKYPDAVIYGIEENPTIIHYIQNEMPDNVKILTNFENIPVDTIICSSVLHEVFSYPTGDQPAFYYPRLTKLLSDMYRALTPGGRLIIRDGIMTNDPYKMVRLHFKQEDGEKWALRFLNEFKGLPQIREAHLIENGMECPLELAREFMYTYTWGPDSWPREVKEQFGYYTEDEYIRTLEALGFNVINHAVLTELGYHYHIGKILYITDMEDKPLTIPPSTIVIIAEKGV